MHDLVIRGGTVVDGTGAPAVRADVAVAGGRVVAVGDDVGDRARGDRLGLEEAVHLQTGRTAALWGFADRGVLAPGMRADLNVLDLDALRLLPPRWAADLPAGGRRLMQDVEGYAATVVAGEMTWCDGEPTGARPGRVVRTARPPATV